MKTIHIIIATIALIVAIGFFVLIQKNRRLEKQLFDQKSNYILREDSIQSSNIKRLEDSVIVIRSEYERKIKNLENKQTILKIQYEKIYGNYSDIIINRPVY